MRVILSGASGLIGTAVHRRLTADGHQVVRLIRDSSVSDDSSVLWNPQAGRIDDKLLGEIDWAVHLSGENIASRRWTAAQKDRIRSSRVDSTNFLCETLASRSKPPCVLVCASAVGYYGDRGDEVLVEESDPGTGFLADTCVAWEGAAGLARNAGIRVVHLRFGMILSRSGGALPRMLAPFRLGLGGVVGGGQQYISWVSEEDAVNALMHVIANDDLVGPVNVVTPKPVTNVEFTRTLAQVLCRPALLPVPAFCARLLLGEMADALLLSSARVKPQGLLNGGYTFSQVELERSIMRLMSN